MVSFGSLQFICVICTDTVFTCVSSPHTFTNDLSLRAAPNRVSQKGSFVPDDCLATYWGRLACLKPLKTPADSGPLAFNFDKQAQRQCFMHQPLPLSLPPSLPHSLIHPLPTLSISTWHKKELYAAIISLLVLYPASFWFPYT